MPSQSAIAFKQWLSHDPRAIDPKLLRMDRIAAVVEKLQLTDADAKYLYELD